jgi:hypothetical protein
MKIKSGWYISSEYSETVFVIGTSSKKAPNGVFFYDYINSNDDYTEFMADTTLYLGKTWKKYSPSEKEMRNVTKAIFIGAV